MEQLGRAQGRGGFVRGNVLALLFVELRWTATSPAVAGQGSVVHAKGQWSAVAPACATTATLGQSAREYGHTACLQSTPMTSTVNIFHTSNVFISIQGICGKFTRPMQVYFPFLNEEGLVLFRTPRRLARFSPAFVRPGSWPCSGVL